MAFDACMMRAVINEITETLPDARIEKVLQPQNDEVDLLIHSGRQTKRLVFNVGPNAPRMQLSSIAKENPKAAPMFCMLLRKHVTGGRILRIEQPGFDRIAVFSISAYDEMGFQTEKRLICEIMGKYANLILTDKDGKIISALKIIDFAQSTVRQIIPGLTYELPAQQNKLSPITLSRDELISALKSCPAERTLEKLITGTYCGIATQIARELTYRISGTTDTPVSNIIPDKLVSVMENWQTILYNHSYKPTIVYDNEGKPIDYSYMDIGYLGGELEKEHFQSIGDMLDRYFAEKDRLERIRQRAHDLVTLLHNAVARTERKLSIQREALLDSENGEKYKRDADLITANIYRISRGMDSFRCVDYYSEDCAEVVIALDKRLTPAQNAQRLYKLYNKSKTAKRVLTEQIKLWESELQYLDSVQAFLAKAEREEDLDELREELYRSGYSQKLKSYKPKKSIKLQPIELTTSGGYKLLVGRNNIQNDHLTFKVASKDDIWFHVKDMPGSHVIMLAAGEEPDERDYTEAAETAAYYSKATAGPVTVDYTRVKNVKKPSGAKPGYVIYKTNFSANVSPKRING